MLIDETTLQNATYWAEKAAESLRARLASYDADDAAKRREKEQECRTCFYLQGGRLVGQAFTKRPCTSCDSEIVWPNTAVPQLCVGCSRTHNACRRCLASLGGDETPDDEMSLATYRVTSLNKFEVQVCEPAGYDEYDEYDDALWVVVDPRDGIRFFAELAALEDPTPLAKQLLELPRSQRRKKPL